MSYCTKEDVNNLFGDISDDISDDMFNTSIDNSTTWINSNLKKHYVPVPVDCNVSALKTVAIYYSASDIILSLYHGETLPVQYDVWFNKAQELLDAYIGEQLNYTDDNDTINKVTGVKHRKSKGYHRRL